MLTGKLVFALRTVLCSLLVLVSTSAMANYLVEYEPYPCDTCNVCSSSTHYRHHARHYTHHARYHHHRRTTYHIDVYYTMAPYPDYYYDTPESCGSGNTCSSCQTRVQHPRCARGVYDGGRDGFATYPVRVIDTCQRCSADHSRDWDTATQDDITEY